MIEKSDFLGVPKMSKVLSDELNQIAGTDRDAVISAESHPELMAKLLADAAGKIDRGVKAGSEDK